MKISDRLKGVITALGGVASRASNQVVVLCVTLVATRYLVPSQFGVFTLASACIALVRGLLYSGAFEYLIKAPNVRSCASECLVINFLSTAFFSMALVVLAAFSKYLFGSAELGHVLLLMIPSNFIATLTAWQEAQLLRGQRIRLYYALTFSTEIVAGVVAILLLRAHFGLVALAVQIYIRTIFLGTAYLLIQRPAFSTTFSYNEVWTVLKWSSSRYVGIFVGFAYNYGADFILSAFFSTAASGLYRASDRIVTAVIDVFSQPARTFSVILLSNRVANDKTTDDLWPKIVTAASVVGLPALAGLAVMSGSLIPELLGPKWAGAGPIVMVLCLNKAFGLPSTVTGTLLVTHNRQRWLLMQQMVGCAATIAVLVAFARHGIVAAAWSITAVSAVMVVWQFWFVLVLFPGSWAGFRAALPAVLFPTMAVGLAAQACLALAPWRGGVSQWEVLGAVVGCGVVGWGVACLPFRRRLVAAVEALGGSGKSPDLHLVD